MFLRFLTETRRLPLLHVLASFALACVIGVGVAAAVKRSGTSTQASSRRLVAPTQLTPHKPLAHSQPIAPRGGRAAAVGQLVMAPVDADVLSASSVRQIDAEIRRGHIGGILFVGSAPAVPIHKATAVFEAAAAQAHQPPLLVALAIEGVLPEGQERGHDDYCARLADRVGADYQRHLRANQIEAADVLANAATQTGANLIWAGSLAEAAGCGGPVHRSIHDPVAFTTAVQRHGAWLLARGVGDPTKPSLRFRQAIRGGARFMAVTRLPSGHPLWAQRSQMERVRAIVGRNVVLATPDLDAYFSAHGGLLPAVNAALRAHLDLLLTSAHRTSLQHGIEGYFARRETSAQLAASCARIVALKARLPHDGNPEWARDPRGWCSAR